MVRRASIEFVEVSTAIREPASKFGGQPEWLTSAQWPLSRQLGQPMRFFGQIVLEPELFGNIDGRMAYLFMTDGEEYVDDTWEADGGENAVIVQPGEPLVPIANVVEGPMVYRMVAAAGRTRFVPEACEFAVRLTVGEDPEFAPEEDRWEWEEEANRRYCEAVAGNKIGGTPGFIQMDEFPGEGFRKLLLQLDSTTVPFSVNFGDCGIGYAFLSQSGRSGKFLWQCS